MASNTVNTGNHSFREQQSYRLGRDVFFGWVLRHHNQKSLSEAAKRELALSAEPITSDTLAWDTYLDCLKQTANLEGKFLMTNTPLRRRRQLGLRANT